ncbi:ABC transporter permease [Marinobacter xestospongiae]|uniref:ABC transporter permease n=1 Tax=Marinobacter xestospongiae TaxID=994319 RepID=A0ABU3VVK7_9GAMM|nr:ABC transporter permease [Marinobacter xestospongiae]MCK7566431.1 ABC transporter permease [Marinobacter xestospongiae]MDV2078296.1 ABC transporter permease [Marinobacter xestospongiae]
MTPGAGRLSLALLLTPFLLWIVLLVLLPHAEMLRVSFQVRESWDTLDWGLTQYRNFFEEAYYWRTFLRTGLMSLFTTALTLLVAFPIAWYIARLARGRSRGVLFLACLVPFWASELVRTYGWMILLRESGVFSALLQGVGLADGPVEMLYNDAAVIIGLVYNGLLFMVVPLVTTLDGLDENLVEAGYDLGGGHLTVLREVVVPWAMPGIVSGSIVVFMLTLGSYLTPILMGGKDSAWFTQQIFTQFITRFNWEQGAALGVLLLVLSSLMVWLGLKLTGQSLRKVMG